MRQSSQSRSSRESVSVKSRYANEDPTHLSIKHGKVDQIQIARADSKASKRSNHSS